MIFHLIPPNIYLKISVILKSNKVNLLALTITLWYNTKYIFVLTSYILSIFIKLIDVFVIAPCTGNTLAKLAAGITDTPVLMAAKAHLRNGRPLVIAVSTNDALSGNAKNIGALLSTRNVYFVPMKQDAPMAKERSIVADLSMLEEACESALAGIQLQPILL